MATRGGAMSMMNQGELGLEGRGRVLAGKLTLSRFPGVKTTPPPS